MLEQNAAFDSLSSTDTLDKSTHHWFNRTRYLPQTVASNQSSPLSSPTSVGVPSRRYWRVSQSSDSDSETGTISISSRNTASMHSRSSYFSDRSLTPPTPSSGSSKVSHDSLPSRYRRSNHVAIKSRLNSSSTWSTPGLPYVQSPFSSICRCHAFEILPSRSVDLRSTAEMGRKPFAGKSCCAQCRDACKIVMDMENL